MPELPEVETTRRGIAPLLEGHAIEGVIIRDHRLRWPIPENLHCSVVGRLIAQVSRRAKYLLIDCGTGTLIIHLGMSGSLRIVPCSEPALAHDHVDFIVGSQILRLRDPRRFGAVLWHAGHPSSHPLLAHLGVEPLSDAFSGAQLHRASRKRTVSIKALLMDHLVVVGVGNIYASESLFRARIRPTLRAGKINRTRMDALAQSVRETLEEAILAGGSTLRDFVSGDGRPGYFQTRHFVYDRAGLACQVCGTTIQKITQGQRSTFFCPTCQRR